jgi:hypothetical protein
VWLNIKVLLAIVKLFLFSGCIDGEKSSCVDLKKVIEMLKYLFKFGIKLIDQKALLRKFGELYINLNI